MHDILLFLQNHLPLASALFAILILLTVLEFIKIRRGTRQLSPIQVTQFINHQNAAIIDIRTTEAFASGHIIGAISVPANKLGEKIKYIEKFKTQPVVLICSMGREASQYVTILQQKGFPQVYTLEGGMRAWKMAELPVVKE